jgi:hypothetical protein
MGWRAGDGPVGSGLANVRVVPIVTVGRRDAAAPRGTEGMRDIPQRSALADNWMDCTTIVYVRRRLGWTSAPFHIWVSCGFIEDLSLSGRWGLICPPVALAFTGLRDFERLHSSR